jgi:beta-glucosidase
VLSPSTSIQYARGCDVLFPGQEGFDEAVRIAQDAEIAIMVMGLSQQVEGEEGQSEGLRDGLVSQGDREDIRLPGEQEALFKAVVETGTPVVLVLLNGSALAIQWADEHVPAILEAWYPGQAGGRAVAETLFGDSVPGGKLPVTFYRSIDQLPAFEDYNMAGRTYRYFDGDVLYPFGYGLSYTQFDYQDLVLSPWQVWGHETVQVSCTVKNIGALAGDEVVQVYLRDEESSVSVPKHQLVGFKRVHLAPGAEERLTFSISPRQLAFADENGDWILEKGSFTIYVGGGQPGTQSVLSARLEMIGETFRVR